MAVDYDKMSTAELIASMEADRKRKKESAPVTAQRVLFPRAQEQVTTEAPHIKQAGAALLDILSLPGRAAVGATKGAAPLAREETRTIPAFGGPITIPGITPEAREQGRIEARAEIARPEGETLIEDIAKDPATMAAALAAPFTAGMSFLPTVATEAGASVGAHQLESFLKTGELKPGEGALEAGMTFLLGGVPLAGKLRTKAAEWMKRVVKPKVKLADRFDAEKMLNKGISGSFAGMIQKAKTRWDGAMEAFGDVINRNKGKHINVGKALKDTKIKMQEKINTKELSAVKKDVINEAEYWDDILPETEAPLGLVPLEEAQNLKMNVGVRGDWNPQVRSVEQKGAITFNDEFYDQIDKQIDNVVPELKPLNKELSELRPIRQGLREAAHRSGNRNLIGLTDAITFMPVLASPTGTLRKLAAGTMLGIKGLQGPRAASALYGLGTAQPGVGAFTARRAAATGLTDPREAAIERAMGE